MRDEIRYVDAVWCAAAAIIERLGGTYHAVHVRRGDFQFKVARYSAEDIVKTVGPDIPRGSTVWVATDERNRSFFEAMETVGGWKTIFLDDVLKESLSSAGLLRYLAFPPPARP